MILFFVYDKEAAKVMGTAMRSNQWGKIQTQSYKQYLCYESFSEIKTFQCPRRQFIRAASTLNHMGYSGGISVSRDHHFLQNLLNLRIVVVRQFHQL